MRRAILPAVLAVAAWACSPVPPAVEDPQGMALPFVEDDYARALADARARGVPLFIEAWAPW